MKLTFVFSCILSAALALPSAARDIVVAGFTWHVEDLPGGGVEITGIDPKPVLGFEVPASFSTGSQTFPVKRIGNGAFANAIGMTAVTLPPTLERIGDSAFSNCTSLASVSIPYGVRSIGKRPFVNTIITGLVLPDSIISIDGNIAAGALFDLGNALADSSHFLVTEDGAVYNRDRTRLYSCPTRAEGTLSLPESLTEIGTDAFFGCFRLTNLNIPDSVTNIGETAFNVSGIWSGLNAPESTAKLQHIYFNGAMPDAPDSIFDGAESVTVYGREENGWAGSTWKDRPLVVIPASGSGEEATLSQTVNGITWRFRVVDGVAEIWNEGRTAIESESPVMSVTLPATLGGYVVKGIGVGSLSGLRGLTSISVPATYEWIGDSAFSNCTSLASVAISEGVREIGHRPFFDTALSSLTIPDSVSVIDGNPVAGAALMREIKVADGQPYFATDDGLLYDKGKSTLLACPATKSSISLPGTVEAIADDAFYGCSLLDGGTDTIDNVRWSYALLDGGAVVTEVGGGTNMVTVPATLGGQPVTQIASDAFNGCRGITKFAVEPGNAAFVAQNGALYSADGTTLVRVPDTYQLEATVNTASQRLSLTVTVTPSINPDGTDGTTYTTNSAPGKTKTSSRTIPSTVPVSTLLDGVATIADHAFAGCGIIEGIGTTVTTNGACVSTTGFVGDSVYVKTTYDITATTVSYDEIVCVPENISHGPRAFSGSGVTEVRSTPVNTIRLTATTSVRGEEVAVADGSVIQAKVGAPFLISLENMLPDGSSGATLSASGLPSGIRLVKQKDKSGKVVYSIEGTPTTQTDAKTITLTARKGNSLSSQLTFELSVSPLPAGAVGSFSGFIVRPTDGNAAEDVGTLTLTTTETGKITAKVITAGGSTSFSASHWDSISETGLCSVRMATRNGSVLDIAVNATAAWDGMQVSGTFASGSASGGVTAQKNPFSSIWYFTCSGNETDGWVLHTAGDAKSADLKVALKANGATSVSGKIGAFKVSASGTVNVSLQREEILAADFGIFVKSEKEKRALSIKTDLRFDRADPSEGVGRAKLAAAD